MNELSVKAIVIGVSITVTIIILTVVIFEFTEIQKLYSNVAQTDISFESRLDEFDKYRDSNNDFNGLDVRNTLKKYENETQVKVCINNGTSEVCDDSIDENSLVYNRKYISSLDDTSGINKIIFTIK